MPTTYNGIGTHYYGKTNRSSRSARCHSCGRVGELQSYNTRLWFVVVFLPVIPLGRKRIIDECPSCRRHMVAAADQYEQARQLQTSAALERFRRERSPESAVAAHAQLLSFHEHEQAAEARARALELFPDDAALRVALAEHLRQTSDYEGMARLHREALEIDPGLPEARAGVATWKVVHGELDEARDLLDFQAEPGAGERHDLGPLYGLAKAYAAAGRHEDALDLFGVILREAPHVGQLAECRALIRKSERAVRATRAGESLIPARRHSLRGLFVAEGSPYSPGQRKAALGLAALVLVAAGLAASNEYIRRHRVVHVVNAGDPVEVRVDDAPPVTVAGLGKLTLAEGRHRIRVGGPTPEEHDVQVESDYFGRWTRSPAWVLNPGGEATLVHLTVFYAAQLPRDPESEVVVGRPFFSLPHVDYAFVDPPGQIKMSKGAKEVSKEALRWVQGSDPAAFRFLAATDSAAALTFAERRLRRNPGDRELLDAYEKRAFDLDRPRAAAFLRAGLDRRPVSIPWHRAAQNFATPDDRKRMLADYDARLAREPNDAALLYLRGRIVADPDRAVADFERSIAADPTLPWPVMARGMRALSLGRWDDALTDLRAAARLKIDEDVVEASIHEARLALGQAPELIEEYRGRLRAEPTKVPVALFLFDALAAAGRAGEIESARAEFENRFPAEARSAVAPTLRAMAAYAAGEPDALAKFAAEQLPTIPAELRAHLLLGLGQVDPALAVQPAAALDDPVLAMSLALALAHAGRPDEAAKWAGKAADALDTLSEEQHEVAAMLRSAEPTPLDRIDRASLQPLQKSLLLALQAARFPARAEEYRREAARFSLRRSPPYLLVRRAIAPAGADRP